MLVKGYCLCMHSWERCDMQQCPSSVVGRWLIFVSIMMMMARLNQEGKVGLTCSVFCFKILTVP